jgi:hypothetical protein
MKYLRTGLIILGMVLFFYGAGAVAFSMVKPVKTTGQWYLAVSGFMVTGTLLGVGAYKILGTKETTNMGLIQNTDKAKILPDKIELDAKQLADFECMNHLTTRFSAAKDSEGIKLCRQLQDRIFELHHGKTEEQMATG